MPKPRVYELARELGLSSQEIIEKLRAMGVEVQAPSSSVDEDEAAKFKRHVRLEGPGVRKSRVYASDEDEGERDSLERQREAMVATVRAERELAARDAEKERAARNAGIRPTAAAPVALPPAVMLAPRVAVKPVERLPESPILEKAVEPAADAEQNRLRDALLQPVGPPRDEMRATPRKQDEATGTSGAFVPRGSYWLLFGGLAVAFLVWALS